MTLTWLAPSPQQDRREFLHSVYELAKSFPEPLFATAIPIGSDGKITMLHIVGGTRDGDLFQFDDDLVQAFKALSAAALAEFSHEEMESAQRALELREIGALSGASREELAVVVPSASVAKIQERIARLFSH
ncbi:MAG TPA: hypothetical protein VM940_15040 [Chthoniobacterales bacterium]|nr:hypothetical protein [Chthoniobacterales bacterium]